MLTIAVTNQKGGVGKTTTTIGLGRALGLAGHRVLVVDLDPQANVSSLLASPPLTSSSSQAPGARPASPNSSTRSKVISTWF